MKSSSVRLAALISCLFTWSVTLNQGPVLAAPHFSPDVRAPASSSSGGGKELELPRPRRVGDIFYTPTSKGPIVHGHTGLFYTKNTLVEAPGIGKVVRLKNRSGAGSVKVERGAKLMSVVVPVGSPGSTYPSGSGAGSTGSGGGGGGSWRATSTLEVVSAATRRAAVRWARSRVGDRYNSNFANNTRVVSGRTGTKRSRQNCSQLVWAAYKRQGINLNDVPGYLAIVSPALYLADKKAVYPWEIRDSKHTRVYRRLR